MNKVFEVHEVTRIIVRGPNDFNKTANSIEEGQELAELLNETYQWAFIAGKEYERAALRAPVQGGK